MNPIHTSDDNFENDVLKSETPVLVDFWAEWCGPCKALGPKLDEIAKEYDGKIKVAKMDVDKNNKTPVDFGIRGVPTLILFKGGQQVEQLVGNHPKEEITAAIDKHV